MSDPFIPPAPRAVVEILRQAGYQVAVRRVRSGSWRYSVNGGPEIIAHALMARFDRGRYPTMSCRDCGKPLSEYLGGLCGDCGMERHIARGGTLD